MSIGVSADARAADRNELGPLPRFLQPFVDWVAGIKATVHTKLLAGFLVIAVLLLSMGIAEHRRARPGEPAGRDADRAQPAGQPGPDMIYEVTAQSHYRAMALLTIEDRSWTAKIYAAKAAFAANLAEMRTYGSPRSELPSSTTSQTANGPIRRIERAT